MSREKRLETADLILRESTVEDLEQFYQWELRPEVNAFFSIPDGQSREAVEMEFHKAQANPETRQYTIAMKSDGSLAGRVILGDRLEGWKVEIFRIYLGELSLRGKGYGRQAMEAVLRLCFEDWGMERVYLDHYTGNPASKLYQSLGFQYEGILRNNCRKNGILYDVNLMSMLRAEYFARTKTQ